MISYPVELPHRLFGKSSPSAKEIPIRNMPHIGYVPITAIIVTANPPQNLKSRKHPTNVLGGGEAGCCAFIVRA
ncbi:hypothetical protein AA103581_2169 [Gluconobacter wancherniae NBRC 103581]|nr:hypothetical protein AA103581_2169 [Gluconobacter wancherniae NBRC 103581]